MLSFVRNYQTIFQSGCTTILHSNQQEMIVPILPAFGDVSVPDICHSSRYLMVSHCFNLKFPNDMIWSVFSYAYCHLYIFFDEVSVQIFSAFFNQVVHFLIVHFLKFFVFFMKPVFYQMSLLQIVSLSLWLIFSFSWQPLAEHTFLNSAYFFHGLCLWCCI